MLRLLTFIFAILLCLRVQAGVNEEVHERNRALPDYAALHAMVNTAEKPIFWLFVGDSITHGCLHTHGGRSFAEHWMELVKWELMPRPKQRRTNDLVLNAGVSGETAPGFLQNAAWRLEQFRPQVVFINFGINDASRYGDTAAFRAALAEIVRRVRALGAVPVLQTPSLTLAARADRPLYAQAVRAVAEEQRVLLVDHTAVWEEWAGQPGASCGETPTSVPAPRELMNNDLHPNVAGHLLMADALARSLGLAPPHSPTLQRVKGASDASTNRQTTR